jgi:hypothetical protein
MFVVSFQNNLRLQDLIRESPKAVVRALNRLGVSGRMIALKAVTSRYNVESSAVKKRLWITKATLNRMAVAYTSRGRPMSIAAFKARQTARGATFTIRKGGGLKILPGTFLATMPLSGHRGVFERVGKARFPIQEKFTVSVPDMLRASNVRSEIESKSNDILQKNLDREIKALKRGYGR